MSVRRALAVAQHNRLASLHRVSPTKIGQKLPSFYSKAASGAPTSHGVVQAGSFLANIVLSERRDCSNRIGL